MSSSRKLISSIWKRNKIRAVTVAQSAERLPPTREIMGSIPVILIEATDQCTFQFTTEGHCIRGVKQCNTINNKNMSWRPKQSNLFLFYAVSSRFIVYFKLLSNNGALTTI